MDRAPHHARRAFTLLELILVLVVLGVLSALAAARLGGLRTGQGVEQAARQVLDQARRSQHLAVAGAAMVRLRLDLDARTAWVQVVDGTATRDPADGHQPLTELWSGATALATTYTYDDGRVATSGIVDLLFLPDAVCDSPGVLLVSSEGRSAAVRCRLGAQPPAMEPVDGATPAGGAAP